jgi:hypothetical protein
MQIIDVVQMKPRAACQKMTTYQSTSAIMRFVRFTIETIQAIKSDRKTPVSSYSATSSGVLVLAKATRITPPKQSTMLAYSNFIMLSLRKMTAKIELQNGFVYQMTI